MNMDSKMDGVGSVGCAAGGGGDPPKKPTQDKNVPSHISAAEMVEIQQTLKQLTNNIEILKRLRCGRNRRPSMAGLCCGSGHVAKPYGQKRLAELHRNVDKMEQNGKTLPPWVQAWRHGNSVEAARLLNQDYRGHIAQQAAAAASVVSGGGGGGSTSGGGEEPMEAMEQIHPSEGGEKKMGDKETHE